MFSIFLNTFPNITCRSSKKNSIWKLRASNQKIPRKTTSAEFFQQTEKL